MKCHNCFASLGEPTTVEEAVKGIAKCHYCNHYTKTDGKACLIEIIEALQAKIEELEDDMREHNHNDF